MADIPILEEVVTLLGQGIQVTFKANGHSMLPFIIGGKENIILVKPAQISVGDIVLACIGNSRYVIHRVIKREGAHLTLMGDGNLKEQEECQIEDVAGRAEYVIMPNGEKRYLYSWHLRWGARLWFWLRPFRRYLLGIYRRL